MLSAQATTIMLGATDNGTWTDIHLQSPFAAEDAQNTKSIRVQDPQEGVVLLP